MSQMLSANTKAILLLTAPLIVGRGGTKADLLTPTEYRRLARHLREQEHKPSDLLSSDADALLDDCRHVVDQARLKALLARGLLLSQAVERWQQRAIWVVSRADPEYPQRLKNRLKENSPAVLYGCGDRGILDTGGLAVVGSRHVDEGLIAFTEAVGNSAAMVKRTLVSGGARGVDQAAMRGALEAGGRVVGVLADSLEKAAMHRDNRNFILDEQLVLVSPYDPGAGFNVGHAMQRNKLIYGLADAALVVSADLNKGGTWAGAIEQLDKLHLVPVYVRKITEANKGLDGLRERGARDWPCPKSARAFEAALTATTSAQVDLYSAAPQRAGRHEQVMDVPMIPVKAAAESGEPVSEPAPEPKSDPTLEPAEQLFAKVRSLMVQILKIPAKPADVATALGVTKGQAEEWLRRLVAEGKVEKKAKPVRYVVRQADLLDQACPDSRSSDKAKPSA